MILDLVTKKESTRVRVRLLFDIARKILIDKYNYKVPSVSDVQLNKRIKEIAHQAGLTRPWKKTRHEVGDSTGKPTEIEKPLYQFITTHVGRHTFDCLLKMRGYSYEDIARYAGHNVDMVKRYTDNCTDVDIDNYELTKINNPENIVKLISEVDVNKKPSSTHTNTNIYKSISYMKYNIITPYKGLNQENYVDELIQFIYKNRTLRNLINKCILNQTLNENDDIIEKVFKDKDIFNGQEIEIISVIKRYLSKIYSTQLTLFYFKAEKDQFFSS